MRRGFVQIFAVAVAALACVVAGGCEAIVTDAVPSFSCASKDPSACPGDQICAPTLGKCVGRDTACSVLNACPPDTTCDPGSESCVPVARDSGPDVHDASAVDAHDAAPVDAPTDTFVSDVDANKCTGVGCPCARNADCDSNLCADSTILTSAVTSKICTKPCCQSEECGTDNVCFAAGTGGNYCVPKTALSRTTLGANKGGASCTQDSDCRSGKCSTTTMHCLDACCVDANCTGSGIQCAYNTETGHNVLQCMPNGGNRLTNTSCTSNAQCHGGICTDFGFGTKYCTQPCCSTSQCNVSGYACFDVQIAGTDWVPSCNQPNSPDTVGTKAMGEICQSKSDCRSVHCVAGKCTDVCCSDADCAAVPGWVCQPTPGESGLFLRCGPVQ